MEIRLTRRPGQAGTMKYVKRYAERLVCVRYRYDPENGCRHKTVELIVETVPWESRARRSRRRDEETVAVRIGYQESGLRERAKRLGAIWRHIARSTSRSLHTNVDRSSIPRRMNATRLVSFIVFCLTLWPIALYGENTISVHDIPTRPGVTVRVLLIKPERPVATVLLFPGGVGRVSFQADGSTGYRGFPVRKPALFVEQGLAAAVINPPSDRPPNSAMRFFRTSEAHADDLRHVIALLRKETAVPVWLIGHSAGTISAANAAIRMRDGGPDGIVLISSKVGKFDKQDHVLDNMNVEGITVPTLVVHHEQDECEYTLFRNTPQLMGRLKKATKSELISFKGGGPVEGDACGSLHYHGFPGIEQEVTSRVADWIKTTLKR